MDMKRAYFLPITIGIMIIAFVGFILILPNDDHVNFDWGVERDDFFQYEIHTIWNDEGMFLGGIRYEDVLHINGTIVDVNVTNLPSLSEIADADSFMSSVVSIIKINCKFTDGIEPLSGVKGILEGVISSNLLPIGNWPVIDSYFEDDLPIWTPSHEYYASKLHQLHFIFEWVSYGSTDSYNKWTSEISLVNGMPYELTWTFRHVYSYVYIRLSLVD